VNKEPLLIHCATKLWKSLCPTERVVSCHFANRHPWNISWVDILWS